MEEFSAGDPDAFGEIHDGVLIRRCGQSPQHDRVVRRLENAIDPSGPCRAIHVNIPILLADSARAEFGGRSDLRDPDVVMRDRATELYGVEMNACETVLVAEVTSAESVDADIGIKRELYARHGIPVYLIVHFDKDWQQISEIEECRLDWSGRRYVTRVNHSRVLVLTDPVTLAVTFADLQSRLPRRR
ncbi:Uma2 family endonuclease [Nocardia goodfellowii]|uniref:Uma2 family endonuclease n=1 Tax=Nocardia goodfellowii TaxID=882446 RepID=A0ABS4QFK2_9NOCA|nr:Uma2 family endonuclease [Nocardia goodfellowii]